LDNNPGRLSPKVAALCQDQANRLLLSIASIWEMQIKLKLGKLTLPLPLAQMIDHQQKTNRIELLPVLLSHILALANLPDYHKDPFDHLLIAQARSEELILVSHDSHFTPYPIQTIW
jgi:PIN domain nuclease of toxin-antitoxin system